MSPPGYVLLEDSARFDGQLCGAPSPVSGETVFNTSMTGYQEAVTDPSYAGQIITFTYPMIGNYGVSAAAMESDCVQARAVIMRDAVNDDLVINTPTGSGGRADGYEIRAAAVRRGIPCLTTMTGATAATRAITAERAGSAEVRPLQELHAAEGGASPVPGPQPPTGSGAALAADG